MKKRNYNDLLIWAAALVTVIRYSAAFIASDMPQITGALSVAITIFLGLSGLGMGILDVIGGAVLFQGWRHAMPRATVKEWPMKFRVLTVFVFGLILNGIFIIVPFTVSRVLQSSMEIVLGKDALLWGWAIMVNVAPYMLIGGISVSSDIVKTGEPGANKPANNDEQETNGARTFATLSQSDKLYIINAPSKDAAKELGVTARAIQKWRNKISEEIKKAAK